MSQKSKLRRKQRNQADRDDEPQGHHYGDAAEYFEQMRLQWEQQKGLKVLTARPAIGSRNVKGA